MPNDRVSPLAGLRFALVFVLARRKMLAAPKTTRCFALIGRSLSPFVILPWQTHL